MSTRRYIAQRATTGKFLEFEVPFLTRGDLTWALSAAGSLKGTVPLSVGQRLAEDGAPLLDEWGTLLYVEEDGEIKWGGIVIRSSQADNTWEIEASSFATYPNGIPYLGKYYGARVDPADVVRAIWHHVQSFDSPQSDLGVVVTGETNVTVGSTSEERAAAATKVYKDAKAVYEEARRVYTVLRRKASDLSKLKSSRVADRVAANKVLSDRKQDLAAAIKSKDAARITAAQNAVNTAQTAVNAATNAVNAANADYTAADNAADAQADERDARGYDMRVANNERKAANKRVQDDGGAYKLMWWDTPDCGQRISELATSTPFDFVEQHAWNADHTDITHTIAIQYPRAGRRRDDLAFIVGDNVIVQPTPQTNGDSYANSIFGLGNGDGAAMLHTGSSFDDGRLRRVTVLSRKTTKNPDTLSAKVRDALIKSAAGISLDEITVRDHANAPIGSWSLGDDIKVQFDIQGVGPVELWHRVVSWTLLTESTASLKLERSDSFTYGRLARD